MWASVVKESVLAVGFHGSNDGRVRVYKNPEDQTLKSCARSGGEGWQFGFLFSASWAVCNLKDLLQLKKRVEDGQREGCRRGSWRVSKVRRAGGRWG